jgi:hypothetical protein
VDVVDVARYARQIALPEIGPEGQTRIGAARVAVVGADRAAETAAIYLSAAGVGEVTTIRSPRPAKRGEGQGEGTGDLGASNIDLMIQLGFDDTPLAGEAARLGLPMIFARATAEAVDMVSFSGRAPSPDAKPTVPFQAAATPPADDASAVLAGTLAAAEALHTIVREASGPFTPRIRHMRLPLDGREPLVQDIGPPPR